VIRHLALTTSVLAICASSAFALDSKGKLTDPVEILKRADAASKAVKVAQYEATAFNLDKEGKATIFGQGKAIIQGFSGRGPEKFNISGKFKRRGSEEEHHLTVGSDAEDYYLVDWNTKKAYVDIDPAVTGRRGRVVGSIMMLEYVHATPFTDELKGSDHKLVGITKVGGEECYEVSLTYDGISQSAHWFFSTKDYLPRRIDRFRSRDGEPAGGSRLVVTSLKVDPKGAGKLFKFKLPNGFEQVDDFAP
jgi:hypothetical protein